MDTGAVYSDFGQLTALRAEAARNPNAAIEDVAAQFESVFLQMMLKSMRDATIKSDLFNSDQLDTYMAMADQQIALTLSEQGGIGIARMLVEQLQTRGYVSGAPESEGEQTVTGVTESNGLPLNPTARPKEFTLGDADTSTMEWEG